MDTSLRNPPRWSTSSLGGATDPSLFEVCELKEQLDDCNQSRGRLFDLHAKVEAARKFVARRFVTALLILLLLATVAAALQST